MASLRRSSRTRQQPINYYEPVVKLNEDDSVEIDLETERSRKKRKAKNEKENGEHNESLNDPNDREEILDEASDSSEQEDAEDESDEEIADAWNPKSAVASKPRERKLGPQKRSKPLAKGSRSRAMNVVSSTKDSKKIHTAFQKIAKAILAPEETPETSLVAALLEAYKATGGGTYNDQDKDPHIDHLEQVAQGLLELYEESPNKAQVKLFNLIFRSIGASFDSLVDPDEVDLEDLSDDDFETMIANVIDSALECPENQVLLCADPLGASHAARAKARASIAAQAYPRLYRDFWQTLGRMALAGTTTSFQVQTVNEIQVRIIELLGVGQPDIRAAALLASNHLSVAMLQRTVDLRAKLDVAKRQLGGAQRNQAKDKARGLKGQVNSWTRVIDDLESKAFENVRFVFENRCTDSNEHNRAESFDSMARYFQIRPDTFVADTFLKFFVRHMYEKKSALVRKSAIAGFTVAIRQLGPGCSKVPGMEHLPVDKVERSVSECLKVLWMRTMDTDGSVQELALELALLLTREGHMDYVDDEMIWNKINKQALSPSATPTARRDALYFVMEQLDAFEHDGKAESHAVSKIDQIARWAVHALTQGENLATEEVRFNRIDYLIHSLRAMDEHKKLVTNWTAMLRALRSEDASSKKTPQKKRQAAVLKQRVILRMLVCSAKLESGISAADGFMSGDIDADLLKHQKEEEIDSQPVKKKGRKIKSPSSSPDLLTYVLLSELPALLSSFKSETAVLRDLTGLPQCFDPSALGAPNQKKHFADNLSMLVNIFQEATDQEVLNNCAFTLTSLSRNEHSRRGESLLKLKSTACSVRQRVVELIQSKASKAQADDEEYLNSRKDTQQSISLALRRLATLAKHVDMTDLLGDDPDDEVNDDDMKKLCDLIANDVGIELEERKIVVSEDEASDLVPEIWENGDPEMHPMVAETVAETLDFLLLTTAWRLRKELEVLFTGEEPTDHSTRVVVGMRDRITKLLGLCFEQQRAPSLTEAEPQESDQSIFATTVQLRASATSGDLRSLLPAYWKDMDSKFLQECAMNNILIVGGVNRFIRAQDKQLRLRFQGEENRDLSRGLLLPIARAIAPNWKYTVRPEAGEFLSHIIGSGHDASQIVTTFLRVVKKIDQIRLLECHMACLTNGFNKWNANRPDEPENSQPTEEEMSEYEEKEAMHFKEFEDLEHQAARLSASIGVGKLANKSLAPALLAFVLQGVKTAFLGSSAGVEAPGDNLSFLRVISKYANWVRNDSKQLETLREKLDEYEEDFRDSVPEEEFPNIDVDAIDIFRSACNLPDYVPREAAKSGSTGAPEQNRRLHSSDSISKGGRSRSTQSSLSPVEEGEEADHSSESSDSSPGRQATNQDSPSKASLFSKSTVEPMQLVEEGSDESVFE